MPEIRLKRLKFGIGDTMRTLEEAKEGIRDGLPFVIAIFNDHYICNSEIIPFSEEDNYEYPPMNRQEENLTTKFMKNNFKEELENFWKENGPMTHAEYDRLAKCARYFYDLRAAQIKEVAQELVDKGDRCMDQSEDNQDAYNWWDGFHNCAEGILRELKDDFEDEEKVERIKGWVARDEVENPIYGLGLCLHSPKPWRTGNEWSNQTIMMHLPTDMFPEVTWESEPKEVEVEIKAVNKC